MALQYGINMPASNIKQILEKNDKQQSGIRTWRQLFGGASLGFSAQSATITSNYTAAMHEAYKANLEQRSAIQGAGLSTGSTERYMGMSGQELMNTYEQFIGGYAKDIQTAAQSYGQEVGAIDTALTERAENFSSLYNSAYSYLNEELYGSQREAIVLDESGTPVPVMTGEGKHANSVKDEQGRTVMQKEQIDYIKEKGLDWILNTDKDGNEYLPSWNELATQKLFNSDGSLSDKGVQFFDAMFNARPDEFEKLTGEKVRGFDEWLSETNPELRDWLTQRDVFNYNFAKTNLGTANVITGRESKDQLHSDYEYISRMQGVSTRFSDSNKVLNSTIDSMMKWTDEFVNKLREKFKNQKHSQSAAQRVVDTFKGDWEKQWKTVSTELVNFNKTTEQELHDKLGTELYEEFIGSKEYKDWLQMANSVTGANFNDYFAGVKSVKNSTSIVDRSGKLKILLSNYTNATKKMMDALNRFLAERSYKQGKTSGF